MKMMDESRKMFEIFEGFFVLLVSQLVIMRAIEKIYFVKMWYIATQLF